MKEIVAPVNCPSCNSKLEWRNDILYCVNDECSSKTQKVLEHWAKVLKIKGLGPATITKLGITSIEDIYSLSVNDLEVALGSEKMATKIFKEIEKSALAPLNIVLPAFGIPLIGNSATQKLATTINNLNELTAQKAKDAGLGPKATSNLLDWFENKFKVNFNKTLPHSFKFDNVIAKAETSKGVVCITGKLKSCKTKAEAEQLLTSAGYLTKSSLTKDVTILVNEGGVESAKTKKARSAGVTIINNLKELLGE